MDERLKQAYRQCRLDLEAAQEALSSARGGSAIAEAEAKLAKVEEALAFERARCSNIEREKSHAQHVSFKLKNELTQCQTRAGELEAESENYKEMATQAFADLEEEKKISNVLRARVATVERQRDDALGAVERLKEDCAKAWQGRAALVQRLADAENKVRSAVQDYCQSVRCAKTTKETVLRILRPFTVKLAAKFPSRSSSIKEACRLFMEQYFSDFWYPDLPDPEGDKVLSDTEDFDEYCPPEEELPARSPTPPAT